MLWLSTHRRSIDESGVLLELDGAKTLSLDEDDMR